MKETPRLILVLTLVGAIAGLLVAVADDITREPIRLAKAKSFDAALRDVLPSGVPSPTKREFIAPDGSTNTVYVADGAMAMETRSSKGYSGPIVLLVGFAADGRLHNYTVLDHKETPGLGAHIVDTFRAAITNRPATTLWKVRKDGGDIDAITAATVSSRAVCGAIAGAVAKREAALTALQP